MIDITNQNYIYIYRLAMILPVVTMHTNGTQRNDKFNHLQRKNHVERIRRNPTGSNNDRCCSCILFLLPRQFF